VTAVLRIGGPLAKACQRPQCGAPAGETCRRPSGEPAPRPHAARVKAAPPEQEARVGDVVVVQVLREFLGVLVSVAPLRVRLWTDGAWSIPWPREAHHVLRLAPEDATTAAARAALAAELPARPAPP
jgi:hypothetical protein